jgi:tRNA-modifying protein YgfZ
MTAAKIALLEDRGVVSVSGEDAGSFLDNLITNDMGVLDRQDAIFAGLLSPQGKVLFDFLVAEDDGGYLLDVARDQAPALVKRLSMYKLRARVAISDASSDRKVLAQWGGPIVTRPNEGCRLARDPRHLELGSREIIRRQSPPGSAAPWPELERRAEQPWDDYHAHRIALGVPEGGRDYAWGEAFPHEALFDQLNGVSFTKGCYVGQEIVARMEHRGTARKRIVRVTGEAALPPMGTSVLAGDTVIGAMGSSADGHGLALLRLDRVADFAAKGVGFTVGGTAITPDANDVARLMPQSPDPNALT